VVKEGESEGRYEAEAAQFWRQGPCVAVLAWKGKRNISIMLPDCDIQQLMQRLPGVPQIMKTLPPWEPRTEPTAEKASGGA